MRFKLVESFGDVVNTNTYYRLELIDAFGDNCGGLFNSKTLWDIIYDEDNEDDFEAQELESLIDKLENAHDVPPQWIPGNVKFAFKETFYNKHKGIINKVQQLLNNFGCGLLTNKIYAPNIVFEDDTQIAYAIDDNGKYRKKRLGLE